MRHHGFSIDIATDSSIPGLDVTGGISYRYCPHRRIRRAIPSGNVSIAKRLIAKADSSLFRFCMKRHLNALLGSGNYRFVYMRASYHGHVAARLVQRYGVPLVLEVNRPLSMGPYNKRDGLPWPEKKTQVLVPDCERIQYDSASVITVDSPVRGEWILQFVDDKYKEKLVVNPSGVDTTLFQPTQDSAQKRKELSIGDETVLIGMASSFRWYNDVQEIAQVFSGVKRKHDNVLFLLAVGDSRKVGPVRAAIQRNSLLGSVTILTQVPFAEMSQVLGACDILISPFNFHGRWPHNCSMKHLEYLAMGKPVVATKAGYANFAIKDGVNGFLIEEGDIEGFVDALSLLISNRDLRNKLGATGRLQAENEHTWYENVDRFIEPLGLAR